MIQSSDTELMCIVFSASVNLSFLVLSLSSISFTHNVSNCHLMFQDAYEMCAAAGVSCAVDASLVSSIRAQMQSWFLDFIFYFVVCFTFMGETFFRFLNLKFCVKFFSF